MIQAVFAALCPEIFAISLAGLRHPQFDGSVPLMFARMRGCNDLFLDLVVVVVVGGIVAS